MSKNVTVSWVLEGEEVEIEALMCPADHDVGIMSAYPEGLKILRSNGEKMALSDEAHDRLMENEQLVNKLIDAYERPFDDYD